MHRLFCVTALCTVMTTLATGDLLPLSAKVEKVVNTTSHRWNVTVQDDPTCCVEGRTMQPISSADLPVPLDPTTLEREINAFNQKTSDGPLGTLTYGYTPDGKKIITKAVFTSIRDSQTWPESKSERPIPAAATSALITFVIMLRDPARKSTIQTSIKFRIKKKK